MVRTYSEKQIEAYIKIWVIDLNESINLKRQLMEHQIDEIAFFIVSDFKNITIADIKVVFTNAKTGAYGELYESLSMDKILGWFRQYFDSRCNVAGARSMRKSEKHKYHEEKGERNYESERVKNQIANKVYLKNLSKNKD